MNYYGKYCDGEMEREYVLVKEINLVQQFFNRVNCISAKFVIETSQEYKVDLFKKCKNHFELKKIGRGF